MEAPFMGADKPNPSINLAQDARDQVRKVTEDDLLDRMRVDTRAFIKSYQLSEDGRYWLG